VVHFPASPYQRGCLDKHNKIEQLSSTDPARASKSAHTRSGCNPRSATGDRFYIHEHAMHRAMTISRGNSCCMGYSNAPRSESDPELRAFHEP
jgi:hypothetical protein